MIEEKINIKRYLHKFKTKIFWKKTIYYGLFKNL